MLFVLMHAPDVALTSAAVSSGLSGVVLALGLAAGVLIVAGAVLVQRRVVVPTMRAEMVVRCRSNSLPVRPFAWRGAVVTANR